MTIPMDIESCSEAEALVVRLVDDLGAEEREAFFKLHNQWDDSVGRAHGIVLTNAIPLGDNSGVGGIFLTASRMNHSCRGKVHMTWSDDTGQMTFRARADIDPGEEISWAYLPMTGPREVRQTLLLNRFNFRCTCELCDATLSERDESDRLRMGLDTLKKKLNGFFTHDASGRIGVMETPGEALHTAHELADLARKESGLEEMLHDIYHNAFLITILHSDEARASVFARKAVSASPDQGDARVSELQRFVEYPRAHRLFGRSDQWALGLGELPKELSECDLERWLWKFEDPRSTGISYRKSND